LIAAQKSLPLPSPSNVETRTPPLYFSIAGLLACVATNETLPLEVRKYRRSMTWLHSHVALLP
jgi:hypothetical protein